MPRHVVDEPLKRQRDTAPDAPAPVAPAPEATNDQPPATVPPIECNMLPPAEPANFLPKKNEEVGQQPPAATAGSCELPPARVDRPWMQNAVKVQITFAFLGIAKDPYVKICRRVFYLKHDTGCIYHCDVELTEINPLCEIYGRPDSKANTRPAIPSQNCFFVVPDLWDHGWSLRNTEGTIAIFSL